MNDATSKPEPKTRRLLTELVKVIPTILWVLFISNEMRENGIFIPTIFYILRYDPGLGKPDHAFAITNLPHHLLNNIFDVFDVSNWQPAGKG
jgi:hypothetical protein